MARVDYFNDPNAPKANSIVPSVTAVALNESGEILLIHKTATTCGPCQAEASTSGSPRRPQPYARRGKRPGSI